jgi:FixJ family two-component response regulator
MSPDHLTIYLIDDDASVRRALGRVMCLARLEWEAYESAEAFLASARPAEFGCIVADMTLTGMSGLDLKAELDARGIHLPFILLTAHDTEETRNAARSAGAAAYFRKPVDIEALLDAIQWSAHPA